LYYGKREFIGFTSLSQPRFEAHFTPCVEIGWRLSKANWNQGFATEAAKACLEFGFTELRACLKFIHRVSYAYFWLQLCWIFFP